MTLLKLGAGDSVEMWTSDRRLCLTEDGDRLVEENDPDARTLWAAVGSRVPMAEAVRLRAVGGQVDEGPKPPAAKAPVADEPEGESEDAKPAGRAKRA